LQLKFGVIEQTIQWRASPEDVFNALLDPAKHSDFTGSLATTSRGTGVRFTAWNGYISGKNIRLVKDKKIIQEWKTTEWPTGYPPSRLEFTLTARNGGTELKMVHSKIPAEQIEEYRKGWYDSYWNPLKKYFGKSKSIASPGVEKKKGAS
jgi:activator of HSP90 ATPase